MSVHQLPVAARLRVARALGPRAGEGTFGASRPRGAEGDPGPVRTVVEGVVAVLLLAGIVGGLASVLAWGTFQALLIVLG